MKKPKHPKVIYRKLGREQAYGLYTSGGPIEIDTRAKGQTLLRVLIHEYLHHLHPEWTEEKVDEMSTILADFLWKQDYRKIDT